MERKIGEIFKHNGEWYQCVEQPKNCIGEVCEICAFHGIGNCEIDECSGRYRSDKQNVIFKKLKKLGEPYKLDGVLIQQYQCYAPVYLRNASNIFRVLSKINVIEIEIKQNKDMEEKKLNLKPFDIQKAREGKPVCTRDGRKARIICFDIEDKDNPIAAAIHIGECESVYLYTNRGEYNKGKEDELDLMMLPEKKEGWVNVYKGSVCISVYPRIYKSRDEAVSDNTAANRIDTVKITWEE